MRRSSILLGLLSLLATPVANALPDEDAVTAATDAYTRALDTSDPAARRAGFREAERRFAKLAADGARNADLYSNLGNAALQGEHIGAAVLAYRRALRFDPDHPRALQNLDHVRGLLPAWVPRPEPAGLLDSFFFWHRTLARSERQLAGALCFALAAVLVAASIRLGQGVLRNAAILPGLLWLALMSSLWFDPAAALRDEGVVVADEAMLRVADSSLAPAALQRPVPGGTELRIIERRSPWLHVRLASGRDAWIPDDAVASVAPDT